MARIDGTKDYAPHPGGILSEEYFVPLGLSATKRAVEIGVPANRLTEMIRKRRGLTADTAIRLGKQFGTTPQFWMS